MSKKQQKMLIFYKKSSNFAKKCEKTAKNDILKNCVKRYQKSWCKKLARILHIALQVYFF